MSTSHGYTFDRAAPPEGVRPLGNVPEYDPRNFKSGPREYYGAWTFPNGGPVSESDADVVVDTRRELTNAVENAGADDIVWVAADIDISGTSPIHVDGCTVAGDGATLDTGRPSETPKRVFRITGDGARITGLRIDGPTTTHMSWPGYGNPNIKTGIRVDADDVEIDCCTIRGFGHAAIHIGDDFYVDRTHIHHCDLVDNPMGGLGYGVAVDHADPLIQYCYCDNNRHSIAGGGWADCGYVLRFCHIGPHATSHCIDMHDERETSNDDSREGGAGDRISIHHNYIAPERNPASDSDRVPTGIKIRGIPRSGCQIHFNQNSHPRDPPPGGASGEAVHQTRVGSQWQSLDFRNNYYGLDNPNDAIGLPKAPQTDTPDEPAPAPEPDPEPDEPDEPIVDEPDEPDAPTAPTVPDEFVARVNALEARVEQLEATVDSLLNTQSQ